MKEASETKSHEARRCPRLALSIPVEVSGMDVAGNPVQEKTFTKVVSRTGAYIFLKHRLLVGAKITLKVSQQPQPQICRVVWVGARFGDEGPYETGIELESNENPWGVHFPPDDWEAPEQVPLAGGRPAAELPHPIEADNEQQVITLNAMLTALIAVLKEKGIVNSSELADMLNRMD